MATIAAAMGALGPDSEKVQPVLISLDPDRDTWQKLASYVPWFHTSMIGLTGTQEQLSKVAGSYRVRYRYIGKGETEHYSLDHSADIYVLNQAGELVRVVPHGLPPEVLTKAIRGAFASSSSSLLRSRPAHRTPTKSTTLTTSH